MEREGIYIVNENNENTLVIGSIDSEIHSGTYECVAKNPLGAASHAITVHIFGKLLILFHVIIIILYSNKIFEKIIDSKEKK